MNLCTNAIQEMTSAGGELVVRVDLAQPPADLAAQGRLQQQPQQCLSVSDNGRGIDAQALPHIFEPFFTTRSNGEGTGLGLFVVNGIVNRLQGHIEVHSEAGQGSTFTIWLPLSQAADVGEEQSGDRRSSRGMGRLLVVDDEPAVNRVLALILGQLGYQVTTFSDSYRALSEFQTNPEMYDMLLCDISMPGLRGDELARRVLATRPDLPVVLCSGNPDVLEAGTPEEIGVRAVLKKPVDKSVLAECIAAALTG